VFSNPILHSFLGISKERSLLESPKRGNSWEGFMIEQLISREMVQRVGSLFNFYRTYAGAEIDLVIDRGSERSGYEFKCAVSAGKRDWANLQAGIVSRNSDSGKAVNSKHLQCTRAESIFQQFVIDVFERKAEIISPFGRSLRNPLDLLSRVCSRFTAAAPLSASPMNP
jgi:hypothetical protein